MTLAAGAVLGNYVIRGPLGSGAMGDVYLAQDTVLGREVALKLLAAALVQNPEGIRRFEQEARVLASLNHPNIAAIHGLEGAAGHRFLVLELVPGETLAERLGRGPLPVTEALSLAAQVARALEAAHAIGVVHRDLKPANVKLRPDGRVSVLDFGLAKVVGGSIDSAASHGTLDATVPGLVLGTPAYMSPEQARGRRVDERTDLWALAVLLFECVSGSRPFAGETPVEVLAAILERPPRWELLPSSLPPRVLDLLERSLEKDPARRPRSAGEVRAILETAESDLDAPSVEGTWFRSLSARMTRLLGGDRHAIKGGARRSAARPGAIHLVQETFDEAIESAPAWSPDGPRLAFCREVGLVRKIFVKTVGRDDARPVTHGEHDDLQPFWFGRDALLFVRSRRPGRRLAPGDIFGQYDDGDVWRIDLASGAESRLVEKGFHPAVSPDGKWIAVDASWAGPRRIWLVDAHGRNPVQLTSDTSEAVVHVRPRWSPDSAHIVFQNVERTQFNVRAVEVASRKLSWITQDIVLNVEPSWSPSGDFIVFSSYRGGGINAWRIPVHPNGTPSGPLEQATSGAGHDVEAAPAPDGSRIAFTTLRQNADLWRLPVDPHTGLPTGDPEKVVASSREDSRGSWSPDGRFIAFNSDRAGTMNIWVHDLEAKSARRLTEGAGGDYQPNWSPDGRRLVFFSSRDGRPGLWIVEVASGETTSLSRGPAMDLNPFFSPDGGRIAFQSDRDGRLEVWVMEANGGQPRQLTRIGVMGHFMRWTKDGAFVIFRSPTAENPGLWRVPAQGGDPEPLPPVKGGSHLSLSPDGSKIMDVLEHRTLWVSPLDGSPPARAFEFSDPDVRIDYPVWSPDGRYVLFDRLRPQGGDIWILEGLSS
jgi:eukaryotic-like serine/threonine-protein kinase